MQKYCFNKMKMPGRYCLLLFCLLAFPRLLFSQAGISLPEWQIKRSRYGACYAFSKDSWTQLSCGNDYFLKEFMTVDAEAAIVYKSNVFNIQMIHLGYSRYGELRVKAGYARKFGQKVGVGVNFYYLYSHAANYDAVHSVCFDVSLHAIVTKRLSFGFEVYNPAKLRYGVVGDSPIPIELNVYALFYYDPKLLFEMKVEKKLPGEFDVSLSTYYLPTSFFGLSFDISIRNAGVALMFQYRRLSFHILTRYNYKLGLSPELALLYSFQQKGKQ